MSLLEASGLTREFRRGGRTFLAVDSAELEVSKGDFIHIVGRSGSGKSTLLALLAGILLPTSGRVLANSEVVSEMDDVAQSRYRNEYIGYVSQSMCAMPNLSVIENVALPHYLMKREGRVEDRAFLLMSMMGIGCLKDQMPNQLSGGELKRMMLARAMMNAPKVLIVDEPTADLDAETTREVLELLKKLNEEGTAIVMVTHERDVLKYGNKLYQMEAGKLSLLNRGDYA